MKTPTPDENRELIELCKSLYLRMFHEIKKCYQSKDFTWKDAHSMYWQTYTSLWTFLVGRDVPPMYAGWILMDAEMRAETELTTK